MYEQDDPQATPHTGVDLHTPPGPRFGPLTVRLEEPRRVTVAIDGAGRDLGARWIDDEDPGLAAAHVLAGDLAIHDRGRRPRRGDVVPVYAGNVEGGTLVGLVRAPGAEIADEPAQEGARP